MRWDTLSVGAMTHCHLGSYRPRGFSFAVGWFFPGRGRGGAVVRVEWSGGRRSWLSGGSGGNGHRRWMDRVDYSQAALIR